MIKYLLSILVFFVLKMIIGNIFINYKYKIILVLILVFI